MASKLDKLLDFYRKQLVDVGVFDENGSGMMCYLKPSKTGPVAAPVTLNKTRLVLPTLQFCRDGEWTERTAFHPLAEQISEGPSPVLNAFKSYIRVRLKATIVELTKTLAAWAIDPKKHKGRPTKETNYTQELGDIDAKTVELINKIMDSSTDAPEKQIISIFLHNKTTDGSLRSCQVTFPIMDGVGDGEGSKFFGVEKLRTTKIKDKEIIVSLLNYVLGPVWNDGGYSASSKNTNSPYYHSLLLSFSHLTEHLNGLIDIHSKSNENLASFRFNRDWVEELEDFQSFAKQNGVSVPALPGNTGLEEELEDNAYEADGEDLGLPWNTEEENREIRRGESRDRDGRDDRDRNRDSGGKRPLSELLKDRNNDREEERGSRDRGRDRDDRDRDRDRDRGRDDRNVPNWKRAAGDSNSRDDRDRDRSRGGRGGRGLI